MQTDTHRGAPSERLALIRERGSIIVGVKTDYPPFGMLDASGNPEGFEHDLAADIARRLG
ncbi:transporter substrate-binding domain-containing protein, partial [Acinetobacter baumannii]